MRNIIQNYLSQLEKEKDIRILLACETGSRAWGFPSPDSDYDVRIIYVHKKEWYLSLNEQKDSIDLMFEENEIDITGWDLRKSLRLLWKSNPPLLERIQSSILYAHDEAFLKGIRQMAQKAYSRIATLHHYLSMARKPLEEITGKQDYKLKRFFYALRASVACLWILEREEIPPIEFAEMMTVLDIEPALKERIKELIELKATISESYLHQGEEPLIRFMQDCIEKAEAEGKNLPAGNAKMEELDAFFIKNLED